MKNLWGKGHWAFFWFFYRDLLIGIVVFVAFFALIWLVYFDLVGVFWFGWAVVVYVVLLWLCIVYLITRPHPTRSTRFVQSDHLYGWSTDNISSNPTHSGRLIKFPQTWPARPVPTPRCLTHLIKLHANWTSV